MTSAELHQTYITGEIRLSDGSTTSFSINPDLGWSQWGNVPDKLGLTVDMLDAFVVAASEHGLREGDEGGEEVCRRCGSPLDNDGYCTDETCPYSDRPQTATWTEG